ncbi:hypothetical protein K8I28_04040 [bacterium]|nr:hypothetical protein [bacterium]
MPDKWLVMPVNDAAKAEIGGDATVEKWYDEKDGSGNVVGRGKDNQVTIQFATSGSWSSPGGWTSGVTLQTSGSSVAASNLKDAMDAGITAPPTNNNVDVVIVKVQYPVSGGFQFEAELDGDWEDHYHEHPDT